MGIGASAGGLEALKAFFGAMPPNPGLAFVVVVHLDPTHESLMPELLARTTSLAVAHARDRQALEVDHVYVIPPNRSLTVEGGALRVRTVQDRRSLRGTIDRFLRSLAEDQRDRAIGIVLSGTGTEGALGVRAIKAEGGTVMVQAPDTAAHPGMPSSAIATGDADVVLPADKMPAALLDFVRSGHPMRAVVSTAAEAKLANGLQSILAVLRARRKHDFRGYKKGTLQRRIERRMGLQQIEGIAAYVDFLRSHPAEVDALFRDLLIGVTSFFRDPAEFDELSARVLSALVRERDPDTPIRIWVAGCSTGEEAYSIAIALAEQLTAAQATCPVQIFATDVDDDALETARAGTYPESIALDVTPQRLQRFFTRQDHHYTIIKSIRESVVFAAQNLISDPPFSKLDLVSCRNVLIYLEPELQEKLVTMFHFALRPGGYLFLGSAEGVGHLENLFAPIAKRRRMFRRIAPVTRPSLDPQLPPRGVAEEAPGAKARAESSVAMLADQQLLEHLAPAAVVVHGNGHIVRLYGAMDRYIKLPTGNATLDLLLLARDSLKPTLRAALHEAVRRNRQTVLDALEVKRDKGRATLRVTVRPVGRRRADGDLWLVVFEELPLSPRPRGRPAAGRPPELVRRLEAELRNTKREQQQLIEQLESGNEELKAANEEILSMNEELQSTNEELVTSKEELQSMNEELTTLNAQLQDKVHELTVVNDDVANLLAATDIATVFLDAELRIKRFTLAASQVLNLQNSDVGRSLTHIASNLVDADLATDARSVIASSTSLEKEVAARDGKQYLVRALPYRTADERVLGVVLTLVDVTSLKQAESELRATRERVSVALRRMTRLHEVSTRLAGAGELVALLEEILRAATEITGADAGGIIQQLEDTGFLTIVAHTGFEPAFLEHFAVVGPETNSICGLALSRRERVVVENVTQSSILAGSAALDVISSAGVAAVQSTPLVDRAGKFLGMLSTYYRAPHDFDEAELRWLDLLARHAADIIDRRRADEALASARGELEERVVERTKSLALVHEVTRAINDAPTWDEALHRVVRHLCDAQRWQLGYVYLPDAIAQGSLTPVVSYLADERFRPFHTASMRRHRRREESLPMRVFVGGMQLLMNGEQELRKALPIRGEVARQVGLESALALPVRFGDEVIAVLELLSDQPHAPGDEIVTLMSDISAQMGRVLERERSTAQMADLVWREQQALLHTLHDALGQTLMGLGMLAAGLSQRLSRGESADAADCARQISEQTQQALEQVRNLARGLFPMDVGGEGLADALRDLAATTQSLHKLRVNVEVDGQSPIRDGRVATQLYRIAQEAVTNAVKHAHASTIRIEMRSRTGSTTLRVADDGVGIRNTLPTHDGVGLRIMQHRATSIGAALTIEPGTERGTVVTCTLRGARPVTTQGG